MKKIITFISLAVILTSTMLVAPLSNSAPASSTGAPGEVDCTTSGCHSQFPVNSGPGTAVLIIENGITTYVPGKTYAITCEINQANLNRFGFELVALKDNDNTNVGTLSVTEGARTQIISGFGNFMDRKYMTYTYAGTSALSTGIGKWSFNWTAPVTDEGPISFYMATIAANEDGTDLGDYCYKKSLRLTPSSTAGIASNNTDIEFIVFPNPVADKITVHYTLAEETNVMIELFDVQGSRIKQLFSAKQSPGVYTPDFNLKDYAAGVYFIKLTENDESILEKIVIAR